MAVRPMLVMAGTTLVGVLGPVAPAVAQVLAQPDPVTAYTMSAGRLWSLVAALLGPVSYTHLTLPTILLV